MKKKVIIASIILGLIITGFILSNISSYEEVEYENVFCDLTVEILGEVNKPAIYQLPKNSTIETLINVAGGYTECAQTSKVKLDTILTDGMVIIIPKKEIQEQNNTLVNINTATKEELMNLTGVGEKKAIAIIEYRTNYGFFNSIEELTNVKGISISIFNKIKEQITV